MQNEKTEIMREMRLQGMTYAEIGKAMGVSKQSVHQRIGKLKPCYFREITPDVCVYAGIRNWMNENKISRAEFVRMLHGNCFPTNRKTFNRILMGNDCRKHSIDKILAITGLTYEEAFSKDCEK